MQLRRYGRAELGMLVMHDDDVRDQIVGEEHLEAALRALRRLLREHDWRQRVCERRERLAALYKLSKKGQQIRIFRASRSAVNRLDEELKKLEAREQARFEHELQEESELHSRRRRREHRRYVYRQYRR
ncbi:hypothetical protein HYX70_03845 [Candidatus Saccharibacteria bacterium]|nr:hypothetical protein [Candidatus Saccharibacteria bacterium]